MSSSISQIKSKFCTRVVDINKDKYFTPQKLEDKRLKRNLELYEKNDETFKSLCQQNELQKLVIYWINIVVLDDQLEKKEWEPENRVQMAWRHLQCFCEEIAYKATKKVLINANYNPHEMILKGFFAALSFIYNLEKFSPVIYKYNPLINLFEIYTQKVLENQIKDKLGIKSSMWRKLIKTKEQELEIALLRYGIDQYLIAKIKFAFYKFFKKTYTMNRITNNPTRKSGDKWPEPEVLDYEESVKAYNLERMERYSPYEVSSSPEITTETLKQWIEISNKALYNYTNSEQSITEYQDNFHIQIDDEQDENNVNANEQAKDNSQCEINPLIFKLQVFITELKKIDITKQTILIYYYGFKMKQKQIGDIFLCDQSAIPHRLKNIKNRFIDALMNTIYEPNNREEWATYYIDKWLNNHYQKPVYSIFFHCILMENIKTLDIQEKFLLQKKYGQKTEDCQLAKEFGMLEEDLVKMLNRIKAKLEQAFLKEIERIIQRDLPTILSTLCKQLIDDACLNLRFSEIEIAYLNLRMSAREWTDMENVDIVLEECLKTLNSHQ